MTLRAKEPETSPPDCTSMAISGRESTTDIPSQIHVSAAHIAAASPTSTTSTDSSYAPFLTPHTSVASPNTTQTRQMPSTTSSTPQFSMTSSLAPQISLLSIRSEDVPIPSVESPASSPFSSQYEAAPRTLSVPTSYHSDLDTLKEANRSSPDRELYAFRFEESRETSPFTFRKIHNATPEPRRAIDHSSSGFGPVELPSGPITMHPTQMSAGNDVKVSPLATTTGLSDVSEGVLDSKLVRQERKLGVYDVKDEQPPEEPYFNKQFQKALHIGKHIAGRIKETLEACELANDHESHVYRMIQTADKLHNFDAPAVCTIGIMGDSGVGKSSLVNSLLDEVDLALTGGMGRACTRIVTEYRHRRREHKAKYTIEIDCMTRSEIDEHLRELLWSYRQCYLRDLLDDKMVTGDELKVRAKQSKLAWDTLHAAFGDMADAREKLTDNYLRDSSDGAEERILEQLKLWAGQLPWPAEVKLGGWLGTATDAKGCNQKTDDFSKGNLWPFVKVIRVFLSSQVLKSGLVLADLPGLHDSNQARVKAAEAYMYKCDEIFVVADINRVDTNESVETIFQQSLGHNLKSGRPAQGISLVCTRSEDLDESEIKAKFFEDSQTAQAKRVEYLEKEIADTDANASDYGALPKRKKAQDELDELYMIARNEYIREIVEETHANRFSNRSLSIFFVSNKIYRKNRNRAGGHDILMRASGIPGLRSYCHKIPARAQFRIASHFLDIRLEDLVQKVQLWLTGGSRETMPNDRTVEKLLDRLQNELQKDVSDCISSGENIHKGYVKDIMINPMDQNLAKWTKAAIKAYEEWRRTYHHNFHGAPLFARTIETKTQSIRYKFLEIREKFNDELDLIEHDASGNHPGSYVNDEMRPTYNKCQMDSGTGVTNRRYKCLEEGIGVSERPKLLKAIRNRIKSALDLLNARVTREFQVELTRILRQIRTDIEMLRGTEAQVLAKNGDFLQRLGRVITEAEAQMMDISEMTATAKAEAAKNGHPEP